MKGSNLFLAKWAILVFVGFSTILSTHLRAFDMVPGDLRAPLGAAKKALGVDIQLDSITGNPARVAGAKALLALMATDSFVRSYEDLRESCRIQGVLKTIIIGAEFRALSRGAYLILDATRSDATGNPLPLAQKGLIDFAVSNCDLAYSALDGIIASQPSRGALPTRAIKADVTALIERSLKGKDIEAWSSALDSQHFQDQLGLFEKNCGVTIDGIQFETSTSLQTDAQKKSSVQLSIDASATPDSLVGIPRAAQDCGKIYPALQNINSAKALGHGLFLSVETPVIYEQRISPQQVDAWVKFFNDEPQRLDDLRSVIFSSSRSSEFRALKTCVKNQTPLDSSCGAPILVSLNTTTSFRGGAADNVWFRLMMLSLGTVTGVPMKVSPDESIFLDVTASPSIPSSIPR